jgi:transcriptional regulator GlxA family with amidase domain
LTHGDEAILKVQDWLQVKGARAISVADMAREAGLEDRTFLRRFKAATGAKPTEYAQCVRMEKAREPLQSVDQIAWSVGYEDAAAFRRVFGRLVACRLVTIDGALPQIARSQWRLRDDHNKD